MAVGQSGSPVKAMRQREGVSIIPKRTGLKTEENAQGGFGLTMPFCCISSFDVISLFQMKRRLYGWADM